MIILDGRGSHARAYFSLIVARFRRAMFFWGLILATKVAFVVVVGVVRALIVVVVVVHAALIFRVRTTLVVRVLGLGSMHVAGLVLGGLFVRRIAFAVALGVWLAFAVG